MGTIVKLVIIGALFIPIVFKAVKYNKWYIYLLFAFYAILPDTFAIEISASLPLITVKRLLILLVCGIWLYNAKYRRRQHIPKELLIYTIVNVAISVINLRLTFGELNNTFISIFEQFLLVMAVKSMIESEEEVYICLDFLIYGSVALGIISILQTVMKADVTTVLAIIEDRVVESITDRMNTVRAFGTSNAIKNGCYCAFMCLITMFMYEKRKKFKYIFFLTVNAMALLCTMTRSALLAFGITIAFMVIVRNRHIIKAYSKYILPVVTAVVAVFIVKPSMFDSVIEVFKSILNVLGFEFELSSDFGLNADNASYSRLVQWSAVYYMIQEGYMFLGYGYNAFLRGCLYYHFKQFGTWTKAGALDTGFVAVAVEGGLLGLINILILWIGIAVSSLKNRDRRHGSYDIYKLTIYFVFMYMIINVASAYASTELIWLYLAVFFSYREIKSSDMYKISISERSN